MHPFVVGEIACGSLCDRESVLGLLQDLPAATVANGDEVLQFIERYALHGTGVGCVDVHLLAAAALTQGAKIWARDKRLRLVAKMLGQAFQEAAH